MKGTRGGSKNFFILRRFDLGQGISPGVQAGVEGAHKKEGAYVAGFPVKCQVHPVRGMDGDFAHPGSQIDRPNAFLGPTIDCPVYSLVKVLPGSDFLFSLYPMK